MNRDAEKRSMPEDASGSRREARRRNPGTPGGADRDDAESASDPEAREVAAEKMPPGFQSSPEPAPWVEADPLPAGPAGGPVPADRSWEREDPLIRHPGAEADRLGAGFHPVDVGDETGDPSSPRPDSNVAEEIGAEVGVTFQDTEPIGVTEKVSERDRRRWELAPASSEDYELRTEPEPPEGAEGESEHGARGSAAPQKGPTPRR